MMAAIGVEGIVTAGHRLSRSPNPGINSSPAPPVCGALGAATFGSPALLTRAAPSPPARSGVTTVGMSPFAAAAW